MFLAQRQEAPNSTSAELNGLIPAFPHPEKEMKTNMPSEEQQQKPK
jgi:hypothetical protein